MDDQSTFLQPILANALLEGKVENLYLGDVHQHFYNEKLDVEKLVGELRLKLKEKNEIIFGSVCDRTVPLTIIKEHQPDPEQFGLPRLKFYTSRKYMLLIPSELMMRARQNAMTSTNGLSLNDAAKKELLRRWGNIVGLIGTAGVGKTTLAKQHLWDVMTSPDWADTLVFFVSLKNFDFSKDINLLQFLLRTSLLDFEITDEANTALVKYLNTAKIYIIIDGLDEAKASNLGIAGPNIGLYDSAKPEVILKNILNGNLLGHGLKWLLSRPGAYYKLHGDLKPRFTARVVGFNEASQKLVCKAICQNQEASQRVAGKLATVPCVKALCSIPMFCSVMIPYALKQVTSGDAVISVTGAFASAFNDCVRSKHFHGEIPHLRALTRLALHGIREDMFIFDAEDLDEHVGDFSLVEMFVTVQVAGGTRGVRILEGDKRFFFTHLTFQEFFAAVYLIYVADVEQLRELLPRFSEDRWEMVVRFLFGLCNDAVYKQLAVFFPKVKAPAKRQKREILSAFAASYTRKFAATCAKDFPMPLDELYTQFSVIAKVTFGWQKQDERLFKISTWSQESKNEEIAKSFATKLPDTVLVRQTVTSCDLAGLIHVLSEVRDRRISIHFGALYGYAVCNEDILSDFYQQLSRTNHRITKLHLADSRLSKRDQVAIAQLLPGLEEVSLFNCEHEKSFENVVTECIVKRSSPLRYLGFEGHFLSMKQICQCLPHVERLESHSPIEEKDMKLLVRTLKALKQPLKWLDIGDASVGTKNTVMLSECIHKVEMLWIHNSGTVAGKDFAPFTKAVAKLKNPLKLLSFGRNWFESGSSDQIAKCLHNIERLKLYGCGLSTANLQALCLAVNNRKKPMVELNLSELVVDTTSVKAIASCVHKVQILVLQSCTLSQVELSVICNAVKKLKTPMTWLSLRDNHLGDDGARLVASCLPHVKNIWVQKCRFTEIGRTCLKNALELQCNQECNIVGIDDQ